MSEEKTASHAVAVTHHWHSESDCCVCSDNPCRDVGVRFVLDHERAGLLQECDSWHEVVAYVMRHGHAEPDPFDTNAKCPPTCRATPEADAPFPCFCGQPDDRERVHRAHACVPWLMPADDAMGGWLLGAPYPGRAQRTSENAVSRPGECRMSRLEALRLAGSGQSVRQITDRTGLSEPALRELFGQAPAVQWCPEERCGHPQVGAGRPRKGWLQIRRGADRRWFCTARCAVTWLREVGG